MPNYEKLGLLDEAMKSYDKSILLYPTKGNVYKGYKFIHLILGYCLE